jgi:hypothetical protein
VEELILLQGTLNPGRSRFASPHDSTIGVGQGFYWFSGLFLLFIVLGVAKAFWDDSQWKGSSYQLRGKKRNPSLKK